MRNKHSAWAAEVQKGILIVPEQLCSFWLIVKVFIQLPTMYNRPQPDISPSKKVNDPFLCLLQHVDPEFWVPGDAHSQSLVWSFFSSYQYSLISSNRICDYFCIDSHVHIFNG